MTYIRFCKDSGFKLEFDTAAAMTGTMLGIHPLEVCTACGTMVAMQEIAAGTHPITNPDHPAHKKLVEDCASEMHENAR